MQSWREIVAISCGDWHSVGARADGSALAAGTNRRGQRAVDDWRDLAAAAGYLHTVALRRDGRVLAAGDNRHGQRDVGDRRDILEVAAGSTHTLALRADGTVASTGNNASCQCDVATWSGIWVQGSTLYLWYGEQDDPALVCPPISIAEFIALAGSALRHGR